MTTSIESKFRENFLTAVAAASIAGALLIALAQHLAPPPETQMVAVLHNFGHGPAFGVLALVLLAVLRTRLSRSPGLAYAWAFVAAVAIGVALEVLQIFTRRDASIADAVNNAIGAAAFLGLAAYRDASIWPVKVGLRWRKASLITSAVLFMALISPVIYCAAAYGLRADRFPIILQLGTRLDRYFVEFQRCSASLVIIHDEKEGVPALRIRFSQDDFPGVVLTEPEPDWRGFSHLRIEVMNPGENRITLGLRVHDQNHNREYADRFNTVFQVEPGTTKILEVPLSLVESAPEGRRLNLSRIGGLVLFRHSSYDPASPDLMLSRVWLE